MITEIPRPLIEQVVLSSLPVEVFTSSAFVLSFGITRSLEKLF